MISLKSELHLSDKITFFWNIKSGYLSVEVVSLLECLRV